MRRLISIIVLEAYAIALALVQLRIGVRTDEAKYLLDIPYPHPPFGRFILHLLDGWSMQELFWRIVLATLLVQAAWLVHDLVKNMAKVQRRAAVATWVLSASLLYQAGTIMMAPLTALQGLIFVWLYLKNRDQSSNAYLISLLWIASLFTAYQAVLFAPLVWVIFKRSPMSSKKRVMLFTLPLAMLALYTVYNPLALASMTIQSGKDSGLSPEMRIVQFLWLWAIGGGIVASVIGVIGLLIRPKFGLIASFLLVAVYILLASADYYAILFLPFLCAGIVFFVRIAPRAAMPIICLLPVGTIMCLSLRPPSVIPSRVNTVIEHIEKRSGEGDILIVGSFGHEWQYGSISPVRRYHSRFLKDARAVICLAACEEMAMQWQWMQLQDVPLEAWVRR
jgi:hypothetical protein